MRIACLQVASQTGEVVENLDRADALLNGANRKRLDLLVLPELAFSGGNFKSLQQINPYLEYTESGITSVWACSTALNLTCTVVVGYPEQVDLTRIWPASPEYYNSAVIVDHNGDTIANYRKRHIFEEEKSWALEGLDRLANIEIQNLGSITIGIGTDLDPKPEASWLEYEFAHQILRQEANLVIISMAWKKQTPSVPGELDRDTLLYWLARLRPVIKDKSSCREIIVVIANCCGKDAEYTYAGTSCVLGIKDGEVKVYGVLGTEEGLLDVDTSRDPKFKIIFGDADDETLSPNQYYVIPSVQAPPRVSTTLETVGVTPSQHGPNHSRRPAPHGRCKPRPKSV